MGPPNILHELKTLVRSMHPVVVVETTEEERLDDLLRALAADVRLPLFVWTVTRGLQRIDGANAIHGTADPRSMLRHLASLTVEGIFHLKDLAAHLGSPETVRAFREAAQTFTRTRSTIVLSGHQITLPGEIGREAVRIALRLPDRDELKQLVHRVLQSLRAQHTFEVSLGPDGMNGLLHALSGLTLNQARQALAWAILDDNRLSPEDVPQLLRRKGAAIQDGGLLEFYPPEENAFELGGFERLKAWLTRARVGFGEEARALSLPPPRGVLIVGVQGCGKSLAAKVIARTWQQPLLPGWPGVPWLPEAVAFVASVAWVRCPGCSGWLVSLSSASVVTQATEATQATQATYEVVRGVRRARRCAEPAAVRRIQRARTPCVIGACQAGLAGTSISGGRRRRSWGKLNSSRYCDGAATMAAISRMVPLARRSPCGNRRQNSSTVSDGSKPTAPA